MSHRMLTVLLFPSLLTLNSLLHYGRAQDAELTLNPNRSLYFVGENVVLLCDLNESNGEDWEYELVKEGREHVAYSQEAGFKISLTSLGAGGKYQCIGRRKTDSKTKTSENCNVAVAAQPKAQLTNPISAAGRVMLNCSVSQSPPWEFFFYRENISSEFYSIKDMNSSASVSVSGEGVYWCRGGRGDPLYFTQYSEPVTIENTVSIKAVVTLEHEWRAVYIGEVVTLRCHVSGAEWDYEWKASRYKKPIKNAREITIKTSGSNYFSEFKCRGRAKRSNLTVTQWSDFFSVPLTIYEPKPVISVSQTWLSPRVPLTLTCSINDLSSGWKFNWFRVVRHLSGIDVVYSYKQLLGSTEPTQQNTFVIHDQKHTEGYACSVVRGVPPFKSSVSRAKFVWSEDPHPSVSIRVHPNRVQHLKDDPVSLSCEGFSTKWRLMRCNVPTNDCRVVKNTINSIFPVDWKDLGSEAVFWCESDIAFSNAVNITGRENIILLSPAVPVLEGEEVILGCKTKLPITQIDFYKDHKVIFSVAVTKQGEAYMAISAISKSDEGFYKCGDARTVSLQSWVSVTAASKQDQTFIILLLVGLMLSLLLIVFLVLISRWRKNEGKCCRPRHNESSAPPVNQSETHTYSSLLYAHENTYETIAGRGNTEEGNPDYEYDDVENP